MTFTSFIKSSLYRKDGLFLAIYKFNQRISEYVHKSHISSLPFINQYWDNLKSISRIQSKLSQLLLNYFNLFDRPFYQFEEPRLRIALLESKILNSLLIYAGAIIYSESISKLVAKKDVLALKESIGENLYFFVSKKASLLTGFAPKIPLSQDISITRQVLFEAGKQCLQMCLANEDENLLNRLILKFPSEINWDFQTPILEEQKTKAWNFLYKILIKEVQPEAQVCFT